MPRRITLGAFVLLAAALVLACNGGQGTREATSGGGDLVWRFADEPPFSDPRVATALAALVDHQAVVEAASLRPEIQLLPFDPSVVEFMRLPDAEAQARRMLAEAAFADDGFIEVGRCRVAWYPAVREALAEQVREVLTELGIDTQPCEASGGVEGAHILVFETRGPSPFIPSRSEPTWLALNPDSAATQLATPTGTTLMVTKEADTNDGACDIDCSLREAIIVANSSVGLDTIILPAGTYTLGIPGMQEDASATGDLDITDDLTISGAGRASTIIDGGGLDRVFNVLCKPVLPGLTPPRSCGPDFGSAVEIAAVTIRNGDTGTGGGLETKGAVILTGVAITNNRAAVGGGIFVRGGTLTIRNSVIADNTAETTGGGVHSQGTLAVVSSTISGNTAGRSGGGILHTDSGRLTLTNSTISGNAVELGGGRFPRSIRRGGGLVINSGPATLTNVTITDNSADSAQADRGAPAAAATRQAPVAPGSAGTEAADGGSTPGGVLVHPEAEMTVTFRNTIIADNEGGDCGGATAISLGHNLDSDGTCAFSGPGDLIGVDPLLGPLADYRGPTETHPLLAVSPAIDAVPIADCVDEQGDPITTDQRGVSRPRGSACDIGAYEFEVGR